MRTPEPESGLGAAARRIADRASSVVRLEIELAKLELKRKVVAFGLGIGLGLAAAVLLLFALGFALAAAAAGLETTLSTWLSLLIVAAGTLLVAGLLGLLAVGSLRRGTPPVPEQAFEEAKLTTEALRSDGGG